MTTATPLKPKALRAAQANLDAFIAQARDKLTAFGADLIFDSDCWDVTAYFLARGDRQAKQARVHLFFAKVPGVGGQTLSPKVRALAKAYVRNELAHLTVTSVLQAVRAFYVLGMAMEKQCLDSAAEIDRTTFDTAVAVMAGRYGDATLDGIGVCLGQIARFLEERMLCVYSIGTWQYSRRRRSSYGRVGEAFEYRQRRLMPDPAALDALAHAFHMALDPRDVLVTSVAAILCSAPERFNEVLALPADCEVECPGNDGVKHLGLRWAGSKGYANHVKLILPGMADVVREALRRIRSITKHARHLARWYEANPTRLYLPPDRECFRTREFIDFEDIADLLGIGGKNKRNPAYTWIRSAGLPVSMVVRVAGHIPAMVVRFADFERHIISLLPPQFPYADARTGLKYSDALLVIPAKLFRNGIGSMCMLEPLKYHHVGNALGQNAKAGGVTVFQRVGLDPDRTLSIKIHQFRHWLNTLAQGANLSQVDIAKWSGRKDIQQNAAYDHVSSLEIVTHIRSVIGDHGKAIGPLAEIPKHLPVSREEYAAMAVPTAHTTLYGFCIHDFASAPCEMFRNCLDCREHVCIKGLRGKTDRVASALEMASAQLRMAQDAAAQGVCGAQDWVSTHHATVERLDQLLSILRDPAIQDSAVIQLDTAGTYSLYESAIHDRLADINVLRLATPHSADAIPLSRKSYL
jgi:hypothetical protein